MGTERDIISATDDPVRAEQLGFTVWDEGRRQYVAPSDKPAAEEIDANDVVPDGQE